MPQNLSLNSLLLFSKFYGIVCWHVCYAGYFIFRNLKIKAMDKTKVFRRLKTKAASLGFSKSELRGIAEQISNNSELEDDANDEDIDAEIDAVLPYLKVGQQQAQRIARAVKPTTPKDGDEDDDDVEPSEPSATRKSKNKTDEEESPSWAKSLVKSVETLSNEVQSLKVEKTTSTRKTRLEAVLKDSGKFGKRILRDFDRLKFADDDDFEDYLSDVEEELSDYKQEQGNEDLNTVTKPVGSTGKKSKTNVATDAEVDAVVANM